MRQHEHRQAVEAVVEGCAGLAVGDVSGHATGGQHHMRQEQSDADEQRREETEHRLAAGQFEQVVDSEPIDHGPLLSPLIPTRAVSTAVPEAVAMRTS